MPKWQATEKEYNIVDLLFKSGISPSKSDVRRMVLGKAVEIFYPKDMKSVATNEKFPILDLDKCEKMLVSDWKNKVHIENDMIIRVGKRKFVQIKL